MARVMVIREDGIGAEVVDAAVRLVGAAGGEVDWEYASAGEEVFRAGVASGVPRDPIESVAGTGVVLRGPLGTPVGFGEGHAAAGVHRGRGRLPPAGGVAHDRGQRRPSAGQGQPEQFEVIVTTNMNGDILSDLTSALVGGLGR